MRRSDWVGWKHAAKAPTVCKGCRMTILNPYEWYIQLGTNQSLADDFIYRSQPSKKRWASPRFTACNERRQFNDWALHPWFDEAEKGCDVGPSRKDALLKKVESFWEPDSTGMVLNASSQVAFCSEHQMIVLGTRDQGILYNWDNLRPVATPPVIPISAWDAGHLPRTCKAQRCPLSVGQQKLYDAELEKAKLSVKLKKTQARNLVETYSSWAQLHWTLVSFGCVTHPKNPRTWN